MNDDLFSTKTHICSIFGFRLGNAKIPILDVCGFYTTGITLKRSVDVCYLVACSISIINWVAITGLVMNPVHPASTASCLSVSNA